MTYKRAGSILWYLGRNVTSVSVICINGHCISSAEPLERKPGPCRLCVCIDFCVFYIWLVMYASLWLWCAFSGLSRKPTAEVGILSS